MKTSIPSTEFRGADMVSPYLERPLRTYAQALADIEAKKKRNSTVAPFIPKLVHSDRKKRKSTIAA